MMWEVHITVSYFSQNSFFVFFFIFYIFIYALLLCCKMPPLLKSNTPFLVFIVKFSLKPNIKNTHWKSTVQSSEGN